MLACQVPRMDWPQVGGLTVKEEEQARLVIQGQLTALWRKLITTASDVRQAWTHAAAPGWVRHRSSEAGRGLMRVILRACTDKTISLIMRPVLIAKSL